MREAVAGRESAVRYHLAVYISNHNVNPDKALLTANRGQSIQDTILITIS